MLHGGHRQTDGGPAGHGHHRWRVLHPLQVSKHIQSLTPGRRVPRIIQVHEEKIEFALPQRSKQLRWVAYRFEEVALALKEQLECIQYVLLIIGNENPLLHRLAIGGCFGCYHCSYPWRWQAVSA